MDAKVEFKYLFGVAEACYRVTSEGIEYGTLQALEGEWAFRGKTSVPMRVLAAICDWVGRQRQGGPRCPES